MLDTITQRGPLLFTIELERIYEDWKDTFEHFWEFVAREWARYRGVGWRGLLSRLATLMTAYERDGQFVIGGRDPLMPQSLIASAREGQFGVPFSESVFSRIIAPFCAAVVRRQLHYLHTVDVAYIPPGAGAVFAPSGKIRKNKVGEHFEMSRRELLASNKRMLVDLRRVTDPEYRDALKDAGVKASPVKAGLLGTSTGHTLLAPDLRPRRAPPRPKVARTPPLQATAVLAELGARARPGRASTRTAAEPLSPGLPLGVAAGSLGVALVGLLALQQLTRDDPRDEPL